MKFIIGLYLLISSNVVIANSDCPNSNYAHGNYSLPAHCRTNVSIYDSILSTDYHSSELNDLVEKYKDQTLKVDKAENTELIKTATAKMAIILSQFTRTQVDYPKLLNTMVTNVQIKGTFKGLLKPSLELMDSMLASGNIKAVQLISPIITNLNINLGVRLEDKLDIFSNWEPNKLDNFLTEINVNGNLIDFGKMTKEDYQGFQKGFSKLINNGFNETSGGFGETGPIFGNTGINTSPARESMSGFIDACTSGCDTGGKLGGAGGAIVGGIIGGITGGPLGIGPGIGAGTGIGGGIGCSVGCIGGVIIHGTKEKPNKTPKEPKVEDKPKKEEPKADTPKEEKPKATKECGNDPKCKKDNTAISFNPAFDRNFHYEQYDPEDNDFDRTSTPIENDSNEETERFDFSKDFDAVSTPIRRL